MEAGEAKPSGESPKLRLPVGHPRIADQPKPLMGRDQTFLRASVLTAGGNAWRALDHEFQYVQQPGRDLNIRLIAGVVERNQDFVEQAPHGMLGHPIWIVVGVFEVQVALASPALADKQAHPRVRSAPACSSKLPVGDTTAGGG